MPRLRLVAVSTAISDAHVDRIAELGRPPLDELDELLLDRLVERRPLVLVEHRPPPRGRAAGVVERAPTRPALEVVRRADRRPPEAVAEPLERVHGAEEVPALADLDVGVEREAPLVDLDRGELALEEVEQLAVGDELLEARHESALEPARRLPADVRAGEERAEQRVEGLVAG